MISGLVFGLGPDVIGVLRGAEDGGEVRVEFEPEGGPVPGVVTGAVVLVLVVVMLVVVGGETGEGLVLLVLGTGGLELGN